MAESHHRPRLITPRTRWLAGLVILLHIAFYVAALSNKSYLVDDSIQYLTLTENLSQHGIFSQAYEAPLDPDLQRPPGYPVLLLLCGGMPWLVLLIQHLMVLLTGYFLFRLLQQWTGEKWARRGAFFWLLQPYPILMSSYILSEAPFISLLALGLWMYTKWRSCGCWKRLTIALLGFIVAIYMRPIGMIFLLPIGIDMLVHAIRRRKPREVAIGLLLPLLLIAPWVIRNGQATGQYTFSSMGPMGMLHGRIGGMEAEKQGLPAEEHHWFMAGDSVGVQKTGLRGLKTYYGKGQTHETEFYHAGTGLAVTHFLNHPLEAIAFQAKTLYKMLRGVGYGWANKTFTSKPAAIASAILQALCNLLLFGGTLLAFLHLKSLPPGGRTLIFAMLLTYLASMAVWADGRYRVPIDLIHLVLATTALALWTKKKRPNLE